MRSNSLYYKWLIVIFVSALLAGGCDETLEFANGAPGSITIDQDVCFLAVNGDIALSAEAVDPEDDPMTFSWTATAGTFFPASGEGPDVTWIAPSTAGTHTVTVTVTDGIESSSKSVSVQVGEELFILPGENNIVSNGSFYTFSGTSHFNIQNGTSVILHPGVVLVFKNRFGGFTVTGTFECRGVEGDPVTIKSDACPGDDGIWDGIVFEGSSAVGTFEYTTINSAVTAVVASSGATVTMTDCTVMDGTGRGVTAQDDASMTLTRCKIWENGGGVVSYDSYLRMTDTSVRYNTVYGIYIIATMEGSPSDEVITGCTVANNAGDGFVLEGHTDPLVNGNAIFLNEHSVGNPAYAVKLQVFSNVINPDFTGNYWGVTDEEDIQDLIFDGGDIGSTTSALVDYSGWLSTAP